MGIDHKNLSDNVVLGVLKKVINGNGTITITHDAIFSVMLLLVAVLALSVAIGLSVAILSMQNMHTKRIDDVQRGLDNLRNEQMLIDAKLEALKRELRK